MIQCKEQSIQTIALVICLSILITSCDFQIDGSWKVEEYNEAYLNNGDLLDFDDKENKVLIIDNHGVVYEKDYQISNNRFELLDFNDSVSNGVDVNVGDSILILGSSTYRRISNTKIDSSFKIDIEPIFGYDTIRTSPSKGNRIYPISIKSISNSNYILKLGNRVSTVEELPQFLQCYHCERDKKTSIILVDQSVKLEHLFEVYLYLDHQGIRDRRIVTNAVDIGVYEGFKDNLVIWQEQRKLFDSLQNYPSFPHIGPHRSKWKEETTAKFVNGKDILSDEYAIQLSASSINMYLVNLGDIERVVDYLKIKNQIDNTIGEETDVNQVNSSKNSSNSGDSVLRLPIVVYEYFIK
jgi:hypothetical protein